MKYFNERNRSNDEDLIFINENIIFIPITYIFFIQDSDSESEPEEESISVEESQNPSPIKEEEKISPNEHSEVNEITAKKIKFEK